MLEPRIKICGLTRRSDAEHAALVGASFLGVVLVPDTPRVVTQSTASEIVSGQGAASVAVVADLEPEAAVGAAMSMGASVLQLHGSETPEEAGLVRDAGPWAVWKALRVREGRSLLGTMEPYFERVDGILLDGWHPDRLGGSGTSFTWGQARGLRDEIPPGLLLIAAGGLAPENVAEAVEALRPDIVDVSSGVEAAPGRKDPEKVEAFVRAVTRMKKG